MSRSFRNGTPSWAKVSTRPVVRRSNHREAILNALDEMNEAVSQEDRAPAEKVVDTGDYEENLEPSFYDLV